MMAESIVLYGGFVTSLTEKLAWDYKTWKHLDLKMFKTELQNALGTLNESDNKVHELIEKIFKAYKEENY